MLEWMKIARRGKEILLRILQSGVKSAVVLFLIAGTYLLPAQQIDQASVIRGIDRSVEARIERIVSYTATEHYAVYRNNDETHPAAEMTVKTTFRRDRGKSFEILSESGSQLMRSQVLHALLEQERQMSLPENRAAALVTSANYAMQLKSAERQSLAGRQCVLLTLQPRRNTPYLFAGTLWVDAVDHSIVQLQGTAPKSHSMLTGPAEVLRQYEKQSGLPMATHARAVSKSFLLGRTVVQIDTSDYRIEMQSGL
jgi:hypothetical protein